MTSTSSKSAATNQATKSAAPARTPARRWRPAPVAGFTSVAVEKTPAVPAPPVVAAKPAQAAQPAHVVVAQYGDVSALTPALWLSRTKHVVGDETLVEKLCRPELSMLRVDVASVMPSLEGYLELLDSAIKMAIETDERQGALDLVLIWNAVEALRKGCVRARELGMTDLLCDGWGRSETPHWTEPGLAHQLHAHLGFTTSQTGAAGQTVLGLGEVLAAA